jgi:hypothetical protein
MIHRFLVYEVQILPFDGKDTDKQARKSSLLEYFLQRAVVSSIKYDKTNETIFNNCMNNNKKNITFTIA